MLFTGKMLYIQMAVLEKDFRKAIDLLGDFGWVEIKRTESERKEKFIKMYEIVEGIEKKLTDVIEFLGILQTNENGKLRELDGIQDFFTELYTVIKPYKEKLAELMKRKKSLENDLKDIEMFKNLKLTRSELESMSFYHYFTGGLVPENAEILKQNLKDRVELIRLEEKFYLIFTSKKGRWSLESELKKLDFREKKLVGDPNTVPTEIYKRVTKEIAEVDAQIKEIEDYKAEYLKNYGRDLNSFILNFNVQKIYQGIYQTIDHSEVVTQIEGWILKKKLPCLNKKLKELLGEHYSIVSYIPEELEEVQKGTLKIPVLLEHGIFFKPFEMLIFSYGTPSYRSFDPTIIFAATFLLYYGMMFADMGQGLILILGGLFLQSNKKWKDFGFIITCLGVMSTIFGFFEGAAFCFESEQLAWLTEPIYKNVFGLNTSRIIEVSMENSSKLFLFVIGIGFLMNQFGIFLNILNGFIKKKVIEILFAPNGIAGFIIYGCVIAYIIPIAMPTYDIHVEYAPYVNNLLIYSGIGCLVLIFFKHMLENLIKGHRSLFHEGVVFGLFIAAVDLFEILLNMFSNNLSFIRIAAFAFSHLILSSVVMNFAIGAGRSASVGGVIVLIIGNAIILGLEGLIVGIQSIRLEYYEFFSKFFNDFGRQFVPFKIEKNKLGD